VVSRDRQPAAVCHGPYDYRLEDVPVPRAGPGEVVVAVLACGICASDVKCFTGAPLFWGDGDRPPYVRGPVIPGHEFIGTFVEFSVMRDPVTVDWTIIGDTKELNIHGSHLGPYCYPIAIDMLASGKIDADRMVTHCLPLEAYRDGIELVHTARDSVKVLLEPGR
jgi:threonine dehydrogenase-like Zn-dependent dehydrogenase